MKLIGLDHFVLTVANVPETISFYTTILGMEVRTDHGRTELHFGRQKINLHSRPGEFQPAAVRPTQGAADVCFEVQGDMADIVQHLQRHAVHIEVGPVARSGARGAMTSVYMRDPDGNLVELCVYAL